MKKSCYYLLIGLVLASCTSQPISKNSPIELKVDSLLSMMTIDEKIGQTAQRGTSSRVKGPLSQELIDAVRKGEIGSMINVMNKDYVDQLQKIAVEESPHGIPLIFARDVIHGFKTIFPIPLAQAASWDLSLVEKGARIAAEEASTYGIRWTFAPMLDVSRDARWGRIAESPGEDPYLASRLGEAYVKGFQGNDLTDPSSMIACAKHFVGYGAAEGGRDYNTTVISESLLRNVYFPPFKAATAAGVQTFMSGFNELNGVPVSGNRYILEDVLRGDWGYDGFVVSDWNSVIEMIAHGYSKDKKEAALSAFDAGVEMEMTSDSYDLHLKSLIEEGLVSEALLDERVRNILRVKFRMGLFDQPFRVENESEILSEDHLTAAKDMAMKSAVLLKNDDGILPLDSKQKLAIIGPLAHAPLDQLGTWIFDGNKDDSVTPMMAFESNKDYESGYEAGLDYSRDRSEKNFERAIKLAKGADVVLFFGGEESILSGEAHSRAHLNLPGLQEDLIKKIKEETGKPIVLVIQAGRPIVLEHIIDDVDAILMAWHPGTMGGEAIHDILVGDFNPSGKLPLTWPKSVGQIPIYYNAKNTGRPASIDKFVGIDDIPIGAWQSSLGNESHYLDDGFDPQYVFGFGMSYTDFELSGLTVEPNQSESSIAVSVEVKNIGDRKGQEVVQVYVQDVFASITRPVKELKAFRATDLNPNESKKMSFTITKDELTYYNNEGKEIFESGKFIVFVGASSAKTIKEEVILN